MSPEKKVLFAVADVCSIILTCGEAGVREFSLNGLKLSFHEPVKPEIAAAYYSAPAIPPTESTHSAPPTDIEREALEIDARKTIDDRLEQLNIEDPAAFEQALIQQELTDEA